MLFWIKNYINKYWAVLWKLKEKNNILLILTWHGIQILGTNISGLIFIKTNPEFLINHTGI